MWYGDGMKICVVTPYFETKPEWLAQAHASVRMQSVAAKHIMVCDGSAPAQLTDFQGTHILLKRNYRDYGNTPRLIGCYQAMAMDADAIAFLDADNWYYPNHLEGLLRFVEEHGLDAVSSARMLHRLDGTVLRKCTDVDGRAFVDTNCLLIMKPAFRHMIAWTLLSQEVAGQAVDQYVWRHMLNAGAKLGFFDQATVAYRTRHVVHYTAAGEAPPPGSVTRTDVHGDRYH
jgi:glycosyltransferase involved in cell wall biosynthesis